MWTAISPQSPRLRRREAEAYLSTGYEYRIPAGFLPAGIFLWERTGVFISAADRR